MEYFVVNSNEIKGRIDPLYLLNKSLIEKPKAKYRSEILGNLLIKPVQYGANEIARDGNPSKDIRYIRITDIDEFGNLKSDDWKTATIIEDKYLLSEGDILFARSGATAGKCFIYNNAYGKSIFAGYLIRFVFDPKKVSPKYVFYYTQLKRYKLWVTSIQRPSGQPNINSEEFKSFKIPLPPLKIQDKLVVLMDRAYSLKKSKEIEAQTILNSINNYILDELGIKLPELKDKFIYVVNSDDVKNKRVDSYYYQPKFEEVEKAITKGRYEVKGLNQITELLINGFDLRDYVDDGLIYLRVSNIRPNRLDLSDVKFVPNIEITKDIKLKEGDVLLTRKGTYGVATVVDKGRDKYLISSEIFRIVLKEGLNSFYLSAWLNSNIQQIVFQRIKTGGIMGHLSQDALLQIKIPIPPIIIQNKIVEDIRIRMKEAEKLQEEAKEELEKTKIEVEKIILGDNR